MQLYKPEDRCDKGFVVLFARTYNAYCLSHGISIARVCRSVKSKGKANMYPGKLNRWAWGDVSRPVLVSTLHVLCEEIGLTLLDFVSVRVPEVSTVVEPGLLRKKPKVKKN
jgi:hypothetical protein